MIREETERRLKNIYLVYCLVTISIQTVMTSLTIIVVGHAVFTSNAEYRYDNSNH